MDRSARMTTCSSSSAWIEHVEYTTRFADGTSGVSSVQWPSGGLTLESVQDHLQLKTSKLLQTSSLSFLHVDLGVFEQVVQSVDDARAGTTGIEQAAKV